MMVSALERDSRAAREQIASRICRTGFSSQLPPAKQRKGPRRGPFFVWLGERDSNPRWRSQSPQSYH